MGFEIKKEVQLSGPNRKLEIKNNGIDPDIVFNIKTEVNNINLSLDKDDVTELIEALMIFVEK
tara:strand:+ start:1635 stop:1823 length:189 start_codon:yes stop_codon:yes gene_type:complete